MRSIVLVCGFCLLITFLPSALSQMPLPAPNPESRFVPPVTTISKVVDEVDLAFTVTDKKGHFIGNLRSDDFALLDNHLAPQRLTFFEQRSNLPLHLAVLIDASDSVRDRFKFEQTAALAFLKKILRPGIDRAFVVTFNNRVTTIQGLTDRTATISKALKRVTANGDTALYDAVVYASDKLRQIPEHELTRKGIVLLSDGVDTVHGSTLQQAKEAAARAETMLFAVSTNVSLYEPNAEGDSVLKDLAASSGGIFLPGGDDDHIQWAFHDVEKAFRNQYVIAYNPAAFHADGSYRTVEVVPRKHGLRANCRKGYYALVRAIH